jgi:hypothetical protein
MASGNTLISFSNELKSLIETMETLLGKVVNAARRHAAGKAATSLDDLHFGPGGFRRALENVANGRSTPSDIMHWRYFIKRPVQPFNMTFNRWRLS